MSSNSPNTTNTAAPSNVWRAIFAGLSASLIGIGLARFAYTPLLPVLIQSHWFSASEAVYLGAANLAGYLIGAVIGRPLAARLNNVQVLRAMIVLVALAFFACAFPISVSWFFVWRLLSGLAGGTIMVLVAATVLPHVPENRKGIASGAIFLGVGLGVAASGTVVPLLLLLGLRATWIGLGIICVILTAANWTGWPQNKEHEVNLQPVVNKATRVETSTSFLLIYLIYALMALGLVPAMVFLADFVSRGLGAGTHLASLFWILYGVGAIVGAPSYGFFVDHFGAKPAIRVFLLLQALAVMGLAASSNHLFIAVLSIVIGTFPPGIVPLVLAWIREKAPNDGAAQNVVWSKATIFFAAFQAAAGYGYSAIFAQSDGDHRLLFEIGAASLALALIADIAFSIFRSDVPAKSATKEDAS
ncbi:YbfB/YjiJ family MFS transporter [Undibacterium sp.]|uniref:YbfB/YjiJ family MFS transporter n=1 Tax=Undibacterium sp. TaxID=1914977 RepID=UPI002CE21590|nr:YbfB/YjiJ family MFS transporter [Undibacterium sp.]HTD03953.1 YbfB/YjiJ family MFS transporter [Undibacterium sp.]